MIRTTFGITLVLFGCLLGFGVSAMRAPAQQTPADLMDAYRAIDSHRFVDLTHAFAPGIAHWPGFPNETVRTLYTYKSSGFAAQLFCHVGQWGTHIAAPAHFAPGAQTVDQIDPRQMLLPLVVIDVHRKVASTPDYAVSMTDIPAWEAAHGSI